MGGSDETAQCRYCDGHVSDRFRAVFGDENDVAHRCLGCDCFRRISCGSAVGVNVEDPPERSPERAPSEKAIVCSVSSSITSSFSTSVSGSQSFFPSSSSWGCRFMRPAGASTGQKGTGWVGFPA
ncbi:DUF7563 family protein [Halorubrum xinjiangense]